MNNWIEKEEQKTRAVRICPTRITRANFHRGIIYKSAALDFQPFAGRLLPMFLHSLRVIDFDCQDFYAYTYFVYRSPPVALLPSAYVSTFPKRNYWRLFKRNWREEQRWRLMRSRVVVTENQTRSFWRLPADRSAFVAPRFYLFLFDLRELSWLFESLSGWFSLSTLRLRWMSLLIT